MKKSKKERVQIRVDEETYQQLKDLTLSQNCSQSEILRKAIELGIKQMTNPQTETSRDLARLNAAIKSAESAAREAQAAAKGSMALTCWMIPSLFKQQKQGNNFVDYMAAQSPATLYDAGIHFGSHLVKNETYHSALRDLPAQVGFDTNKFAGCDRQTWQQLCDKQSRQHQPAKEQRNNKKPRNRNKNH